MQKYSVSLNLPTDDPWAASLPTELSFIFSKEEHSDTVRVSVSTPTAGLGISVPTKANIPTASHYRLDTPSPINSSLRISASAALNDLSKLLPKKNQQISLAAVSKLGDKGPVLPKSPPKVIGNFTEDYDISAVDAIVRDYIRVQEIAKPLIIQAHLMGAKRRIQGIQSYGDRIDDLQKIREYEAELDELQSGAKMRRYVEQADPLLQVYRSTQDGIKVDDFSLEEKHSTINLPQIVRIRIDVIETYLNLARKYIDIDVIRRNRLPSDMCHCGVSLTKTGPNDNGMQVCPGCFTEHPMAIVASLSKDNARINNSGSGSDESIENFLRTFDRYQGDQQKRLVDTLEANLDVYFVSKGKKTGKEIRALPKPSGDNMYWQKGNTNHPMLWDALEQIGRSDYYEDVNLVGKFYWGWELPKLHHLRDKIIEQYLKTQRVFCEIPPEERERGSSLGTQFRLWVHLRLVGWRCSRSEFKIADNPDSYRTHIRLWRIMCERANDPEIYFME